MRIHKILSLALAMLLVLPVGMAIAQTEDESSQSQPLRQTFDDKSRAREQLQTRITERRAALLEQLTDVREQRLVNRCEAAQNRLQAALSNAEAVYENRARLYQNVLDKLNGITSRIALNEQLDTSELSNTAEELQTAVTGFFEQFDIYIVTLETAVNDEDCSDTPEDFHVNLQIMRELRAELRSSAQEIRQLLSNDLKDDLVDLRQSLQEPSEQEEAN